MKILLICLVAFWMVGCGVKVESSSTPTNSNQFVEVKTIEPQYWLSCVEGTRYFIMKGSGFMAPILDRETRLPETC